MERTPEEEAQLIRQATQAALAQANNDPQEAHRLLKGMALTDDALLKALTESILEERCEQAIDDFMTKEKG